MVNHPKFKYVFMFCSLLLFVSAFFFENINCLIFIYSFIAFFSFSIQNLFFDIERILTHEMGHAAVALKYGFDVFIVVFHQKKNSASERNHIPIYYISEDDSSYVKNGPNAPKNKVMQFAITYASLLNCSQLAPTHENEIENYKRGPAEEKKYVFKKFNLYLINLSLAIIEIVLYSVIHHSSFICICFLGFFSAILGQVFASLLVLAISEGFTPFPKRKIRNLNSGKAKKDILSDYVGKKLTDEDFIKIHNPQATNHYKDVLTRCQEKCA